MKYLALIFIAIAFVTADTWTVIVSGSDGFWNYRHQSDACHAYQLHVRNGIPASNIIHFNFDDVANHSYNPFKNQLYNQPGDESPDNYEGCVIDYRGKHATPEVYLATLTGDADKVTELTGIKDPKVLKSNSDDMVFLSFFDHGAPGLIAFPEGNVVTAQQLNTALQQMFAKKMYRKLVYYLEACESGSMFNKLLPENLNIYATTAATPDESSWATYCGAEAVVKGVDVGSCLGDLYSVAWMEDADKGVKTETLKDSWNEIKKRVTLSEPQQYGDKTFLNELFFNFVGNNKSPNARSEQKRSISWNSRDVQYKTLEYLVEHGSTEEIKQKAQGEFKLLKDHMRVVDGRFLGYVRELVSEVDARHTILTAKNNVITESSENCYYKAVEAYKQKCGLKEYDLKYMSTLLNVCNNGVNAKDIVSSINRSC